MTRFWTIWTLSWTLAINFFSTSDAQIRPLTFAMRKLAFATNQFGMDLYRAMRIPENEDVGFCPLCISSSLAMILLGAQGRPANNMQQTLYLGGVRPDDVHIAFHDLLTHLRMNLPMSSGHNIIDLNRFRQDYGASSSSKPKDLDIHMINSICVQRDYTILYQYQKFLQGYYNISVHQYDFGSMFGEESRQHINAIVEKQTDSNIQNILPHRLPKTTSVLLLSALSVVGSLDTSGSTAPQGADEPPRHDQFPMYASPSMQHFGAHLFEGNYPFQQIHSRLPPLSAPSYYAPSFASVASPYAAAPSYASHNFHSSPTRTRQGGLRHGQYDYLGCTAVEIPFKNEILSLVVFVPGDGNSITMLETRLNAQHIADILSTMKSKHVILEVPPIVVEDSPKNLTQALFRSGLVDLFTPGFAELAGMSDNRWLHITNLIHKTKVNIKMGANLHSTTPPSGQETIHMSLQDRPFLFFIIDNTSGLSLAMGKIAVKR